MRRCLLDPLAVVALLVMTAGVAARVLQQEEPVVPVHREPRHRLVFDSPMTKILDVQVPPGETTLFHTHSDPILYVQISPSTTRNQTLGGEWSSPPTGDTPPSATRTGRMFSVTDYAERPLTHRVNNIGPSLYRVIGTINSSAGDESPVSSADFAGKPEVDNRWFRGYRWMLGGAVASEHRHVNPVAIVLVTGRTEVSGPGKTALDKPGAFAWVDANTPHRIQSIGGAAEVVEVEVRRPR